MIVLSDPSQDSSIHSVPVSDNEVVATSLVAGLKALQMMQPC